MDSCVASLTVDHVELCTGLRRLMVFFSFALMLLCWLLIFSGMMLTGGSWFWEESVGHQTVEGHSGFWLELNRMRCWAFDTRCWLKWGSIVRRIHNSVYCIESNSWNLFKGSVLQIKFDYNQKATWMGCIFLLLSSIRRRIYFLFLRQIADG